MPHRIGCVHRVHLSVPDWHLSLTPFRRTHSSKSRFSQYGVLIICRDPVLEWPVQDLRQTITQYFTQRQTFTTIRTEPADLRLVVKAWLTLRPGPLPLPCPFGIRCLTPRTSTDKTYAAEGEGSGIISALGHPHPARSLLPRLPLKLCSSSLLRLKRIGGAFLNVLHH